MVIFPYQPRGIALGRLPFCARSAVLSYASHFVALTEVLLALLSMFYLYGFNWLSVWLGLMFIVFNLSVSSVEGGTLSLTKGGIIIRSR